MLNSVRITNFKAFGETQNIPLRPITLIYGPNSAGKSSIIQSILLIKQSMQTTANEEKDFDLATAKTLILVTIPPLCSGTIQRTKCILAFLLSPAGGRLEVRRVSRRTARWSERSTSILI